MDAPIGVIDSGVGGLTVLKELVAELPNERFIYIGDTARCPYGPRSAQEVKTFTFQMATALHKMGIKLLVVACNTATAVALDALKRHFPFPVVGVIFPGARAAIKKTKSNKIAILGTVGTIQSGAYEKALKALSSSCQIVPHACPAFVPLVESDEYEGDFATALVKKTLQPIVDQSFDTVILGCTHYPLLQHAIQEAVGNERIMVSSAEETAREVKERLQYENMFRVGEDSNAPLFYTTGSIPIFKSIVRKWLQIEQPNIQTIKFE